ncbi:hypothetical protein [Kibdelosporangium phytohabitans]|uniref:hypothetical protein n=1 Tax=Kibdelosporangium phytohabitans TaxID=860235 RepID=UPI0012F82073|nr:hypothetical protein [Kibdelosporangium phytohabitans]MBE1470379.1 hypothetical protein [Kibdelosporangium phytohabitans]
MVPLRRACAVPATNLGKTPEVDACHRVEFDYYEASTGPDRVGLSRERRPVAAAAGTRHPAATGPCGRCRAARRPR